jgi:hypothetical protein
VALGIDAPRIHVVPCGVDVPTEARVRTERRSVHCVAVGRMVAKKAPILLLDAFRRAHEVCPRLRLDYVGGGPLELQQGPLKASKFLTIRRPALSTLEKRTRSSGKSGSKAAPHCHPVRPSLAVPPFVALWLGTAIAYAGPFDIPPSDFSIMDADGKQVIGHAHYEVTPDGTSHVTAFGEDRFNDGEYDVESDQLELHDDDQVPRMLTFEHTFFNANGTRQRVNKANFQTGAASCIQYENGQPAVLSAVLDFPPDTFAGSAIVVPLKGYLRLRKKGGVVLHDFNCIPGPEILKIKAYPQPASKWVHLPGELVRVDIKPDFGWLSFLIAPFVPEIRAWFSPSDDWRFVGGQFTRFYKGPEIILVLVPETGRDEASPR